MEPGRKGEMKVYEVRTVYQKKDLVGVTNAYYYTVRPMRVLNKVMKGLSLVLGILFTVFSLIVIVGMLFFIPAFESEYRSYLIFSALFGATIWLLIGLRLLRKSNVPLARGLAWKNYQQKGEELRFRFDPYHFVQERSNARSEIEYRAILRVCEDIERFYLFDSPRTAFIVPKRDFQQGEPDEFRDFIARTTGKSVEYIK